MDERKHTVETYFDEITEDYARQYEYTDSVAQYPTHAVRVQKAIRLLRRFKPSGNVLDIGCGTGQLALQLVGHAYEVVGIDISPQMVKWAERYVRSKADSASAVASFRVGDVEELDLPDGSMDAVVALGVLEWLADDRKAFSEIRRVLRPDGIAIIDFRNRLFDLFSLNAYTQRDVTSKEYAHLLAEFQSEAQQGISALSLEGFVRELTDHASALALGSTSNDNTAIRLKPSPVELGQHTPREAREAAKRYGLECCALAYLHFHPFPPVFEQANPEVFNRLGLIMEALDETPIGCIMASAFIAAFQPVG